MFSTILLFLASLFYAQPAVETSYVQVYDITDLTISAPDFTDAPEMNLNILSVLSGNRSNPLRYGPTRTSFDPKNVQELIDLIQTTIEPDAWGDSAFLYYRNNSLVVKAPQRIHEQLR